ncbi:MAG: DUF2306 domain-containing protein [Alphaproteobacteria bacterium]|nr:DUF2306 domain-containing protein [Alphaproteobacteria bacterium]
MNYMLHNAFLNIKTSPKIMASLRWPLRLILVAVLLFVTYTGLRAITETFDNENFPEALAVKLQLLPLIFPIHMATGGLALLLVPLMIWSRGTPLHKRLGWPVAAVILVAGATAPFVALIMPVTTVSALGFAAQAVVWLALLAAGLWHVRHGRIEAHQNCMILMAAVTSGAVFFRVYLGLFARFGDRHYFYLFYACDAWLAWGLPLIMVALLIRRPASPNSA